MLWELYIFVSGGGGGSVSENVKTQKVIFKVTSYSRRTVLSVIIKNNCRALKICAFVMGGILLSP